MLDKMQAKSGDQSMTCLQKKWKLNVQPTVMASQTIRLRTALPTEAEALARIMCAAMPMDPQWNYRFPRRLEFPEDHLEGTRQFMEGFLQDDNTHVNVITFPSPGVPEEEEIPQALAVWEVKINPDAIFAKPGTLAILMSSILPILRLLKFNK
jgi:hypothetical protein